MHKKYEDEEAEFTRVRTALTKYLDAMQAPGTGPLADYTRTINVTTLYWDTLDNYVKSVDAIRHLKITDIAQLDTFSKSMILSMVPGGMM